MKRALKYLIPIAIILIILGGFLIKASFQPNKFQERDRQIISDSVIPKLDLTEDAGLLINELKQENLTIEVAQYMQTPLMELPIVNYNDREEPQITGFLPWFYYSPNIEKRSPQSYAQKLRLLKTEAFNDFAWYRSEAGDFLYQNGQPYSGWYSTAFDGWQYYLEGRNQGQLAKDNQSVATLLKDRQFIQALVPLKKNLEFYRPIPTQYIDIKEESEVYPHILFKSPDQLIFTKPPGTKGAALLTNTGNYVDIPMEVVQEVTTSQGVFLKVKIGYDDLGWIAKDPTYTNYVRTYYSEQELLDTIKAILEEELSYIGAIVGASFVNNETMAQISVNNQIFFPASTQKIYVMGEVYHQYAQGILSPDDSVVLNDWDKVPGAGIIQDFPSGSVFTIDELVNLVMIYSDNTAANLLIDTVGGGAVINPKVHQLGLYETHIEGKYYMSEGNGFTTSPYDAARYFAYLYNEKLNGDPWDTELVDKFFMNTHNFLRAWIPYTTTSWNKSGLGGTEQNDVATFVTPYGSYSLAVYTAYPDNYDGIAEHLGRLSLRVHDAFNDIRSLLWETVPAQDF